MVLSDKTIKRLLEEKTLLVEPLGENSIGPASIDLRLDSNFLVLDEHGMDIVRLDSAIHYREVITGHITLPPHSFILATTMEYIELSPMITGAVEGRSSIGRLGLFIQNAGWIDPGFKGNITLELYNANSLPIRLDAGRRICQLVLYNMDQPVEKPYAGKYLGQRGTTGSRVYKDVEVAS